MFGRRKDNDARNFGSRSGRQHTARPSRAAGKERGSLFSRRQPVKNSRAQRPAKADKPARPGFFSRWDWGRVRLWVVGVVFSLLWMALWARAYYLQIVMGPEYADRARRQHTAKEVVAGVRGNIMDRNGNILAKSVDCRSAWANPALVQDKQAAAVKLAQALNEPPGRILGLLNEKRQFVWIARKLDYHTAEKIKALNLPGVSLESEFERVYPYKHLAGQLLGFVNIDDKGLEGLEKSFEGKLAGRKVTQLVERDAAGRRMVTREAGDISELRGQDVRLSIDLQVQFFAEEALAESVSKFGAKWGGCIVVDVPSGDILAWAQYPFFDPNNVTGTAVADRRNRLAMDMLEQGSTIKSFLIAAALEEKVVSPSTEINCEKGVWKLRNIVLHDTHAYTNLSVAKILHVSSNIGAAKIGLKLGANKYRDYLARLGFGERTGLPLSGEAKGILRTTKKWSDIDLANASFGQSFSATLVQMAGAYLCIANGGEKRELRLALDDREPNADRFDGQPDGPPNEQPGAAPAPEASPPQLAAGLAFASTGIAPSGGERIFSAGTARQVRSMMRDVVEEDGGTGKEARIAGMDVGGKTGTAQKASRAGGYGKGRVGSFVGIVPVEDPRYLILVLLDEPTTVQYGGVIAAPVFKHVALNTLAYQGQLPDTDDPQVREAMRKAEERKARANGKGKKQTRATAAGNAPEPARNNAPPAERTPNGQAGAQTAAATPARNAPPAEFARRAGRPSPVVPSVVGLGMRNAVETFAAEGIVPVIRGKGGVVVRQTPEPGMPWPDGGRECILWLEESAS